MKKINLFVGYDSREIISFHTLVQSVIENTLCPVSITPISLSMISDIYKRELSAQSTEFTYSRFLVPFLSDYTGYSIFCDCDFIFNGCLMELLSSIDPNAVVSCVKHEYTPVSNLKFNGEKQITYPMKNWSSLMIFNNEKCSILTPEYINSATGKVLHRFEWIADKSSIGSIPEDWNFLVGEYQKENKVPRGIHYTLGGPWFREQENCDYSDYFYKYKRLVNSSLSAKL